MIGSTINIAEFRCRPVGRTNSFSRASFKSRGFSAVETETSTGQSDQNLLHVAILQEDPTVYDIGIAREAQRMRHRTVFRPMSIQRKAKVLRFSDADVVQLGVRVEESRRSQARGARPDGPYDFPPAA